jgi:hypothetical protein
VTFTFDATQRIVWLNDLSDGNARAGDLCTRHADALVPPQGWSREDDRPPRVTREPSGMHEDAATRDSGGVADTDELLPHREPKRRRRKTQRWSDVPSLFDAPAPGDGLPGAAPTILELVEPDPAATIEAVELPAPDELEPAEAREAPEALEAEIDITPAWEPRFEIDDLDGLLDAKSPLLSRAFRAAKAPNEDDDVEIVAVVDPDEVF